MRPLSGAPRKQPLIETVLRPGDCLYLPRGFLHAAKALGGVTNHLTIGVHSWTRYALAEQLLNQALRAVATDPGVRTSLPLGVDLTEPTSYRSDLEQARTALVEALQRVDPDDLVAPLQHAARGTQRAAPVGPLRQLRDAEALTADTVLRPRPYLAAQLDHGGPRTLLRSRAGDLPLDEADVAPVKSLLASGTARADELGLDLARRLLLAGVAVTG